MPEAQDIAARISALRLEIQEHEDRYRNQFAPTVSDREFDLKVKELADLERRYPLFATVDSPTRTVGTDHTQGFRTVAHRKPMLSLDNTYNQGELFSFHERLARLLPGHALEYVVEPKIDGLAIALTYERGVLVQAVTRGNGVEGDDVTANVRTIHSLPARLQGSAADFPAVMELRGEVYMTHEEFTRINQERAARGQSLYMNPRNLAAGTLKQLDAGEVARRKLEIVVYGVGYCEGWRPATQSAIHSQLTQWGLPELEKFWCCPGIDDAWRAVQELSDLRAGFAYPTDGAVLKLNDLAGQALAGFTSKAPRWAISYKFAAEQAVTRLHSITIQIGRTGALTPVAELEPVLVAGSTVARATLHNEDEIARKDIREGDWVVIEKAGEVIPAVVKALADKRPAGSRPFDFAARLAEMGLQAKREPGQAVWRLMDSGSPEVLRRAIEHFAGRTAMDIEGLGTEVVRQLVAKGLVGDIADLYTLKVESLLQLDKFAQKSAQNLVAAIEASRGNDVWRLLHGLGIPQVGAQSAKDLAAHFGSMQALAAADVDALQKVNGVGAVVAESIRAWFGQPANKELVRRLSEDHGLNMVAASSAGVQPLRGQTYVITGTLPQLSRDEARLMIEAAGGRVSGSVSAKTTALIAGTDAGSKLDKAKKTGVPVLSWEEFLPRLAVPARGS